MKVQRNVLVDAVFLVWVVVGVFLYLRQFSDLIAAVLRGQLR